MDTRTISMGTSFWFDYILPTFFPTGLSFRPQRTCHFDRWEKSLPRGDVSLSLDMTFGTPRWGTPPRRRCPVADPHTGSLPLGAFGFQESRSFPVVIFLLQVLAAVQFNDQFLARGTKVDNIRSNGMLVSKVDLFETVRLCI